MTQMTVLQPADPFPSLTVALPGGRTLRLPDALAGRFGVVLYYRGSWCPYRSGRPARVRRRWRSAPGHLRQRVGLPAAAAPGLVDRDSFLEAGDPVDLA